MSSYVKIEVDELQSIIARARSVAALLIENGSNIDVGFRMNHTIVCDAISSIDSYLEDINKMSEAADSL